MAFIPLPTRHRRDLPRGRRPILESLERRDLLAAYTTPEDTPLTVADASLTGGIVLTPPEHGKLTLSNTGGFVYAPALNYNGGDRFVYVTATAGTGSTLPTTLSTEITLTVTPVNDAPLAHNDYYQMLQGSVLKIETPGVLRNDIDVDGDPLIAQVGTQPAHGVLTLNDNGSFTYTPAADFYGLDSFTYKAKDAATASEPATVSIYVGPLIKLPLAMPDFYSTPQNTLLTIAAPGVLANDVGIDGRPLTASLEHGPAHGTLELKADGSFTYKPAADYTGADSFIYRATDVSPLANPLPPASALATVTIYVRPLTPIVVAVNDFYTATQNTPLDVAPPGVLQNDYVIYGDQASNTLTTTPAAVPLTATLVTGPGHGTVELRSDGSLNYVPAQDFYGADTFTYRAALSPTTAGGTTATVTSTGQNGSTTPIVLPHDVATVTIYVKPPEPPPGPVARNDSFLTAENTTLEIRAPGVLANDYVRPADTVTNSDAPINPPLTAVLVAGPAHGTLMLNGDGSFKYVPPTDYVGLETFTYQASQITTTDTPPLLSNIATVTIRVAAAIAHNDFYSTLQDKLLDVAAPGVLANDAGGSAEHPLIVTPLSSPLHGQLTLNPDGSFTYLPSAGFTGADYFSYRAGDGTTPTLVSPATNSDAVDIALVKIYVRPLTATVEAHNDKYATPKSSTLTIPNPGLLANDSAPADHSLTASVVDAPGHGTVTIDPHGGFSYTPQTDFIGEDHFVYRATDSSANAAGTAASSLAVVTIYVLPIDPLPKFILGSDQYTTDESGEQRIADWATVVPIVGQPPAGFIVNSDKPQLFATPPAIDATGQLTYTPAPNVNGVATVTVTLNDGATSDTTTFQINIAKPHALFNTALPCDVTADHVIAPDDALVIINWLNAHTGASAAPEGEPGTLPYYDVNRDDAVAPIDALMVINYLNAHSGSGGEGESAAATDLSLLALLAGDTADATLGRRRTS